MPVQKEADSLQNVLCEIYNVVEALELMSHARNRASQEIAGWLARNLASACDRIDVLDMHAGHKREAEPLGPAQEHAWSSRFG